MEVKEMEPGADTSLGDELVASLAEGLAILRGETRPSRLYGPPPVVDVRAIRRKLGLSQTAFANRFGFTAAAVREWEQGRRRPEQAARTLLLVIERNPQAVTEALDAAAA